jgi:hypothetical protein
MGAFTLNKKGCEPRKRAMSGRAYFQKAARDLKLDGQDPVAIQDLERLDSKTGRRRSRVGGHIAWNLRRLTPQETRERAERSERFLKQDPVSFPAEEELEQS